MLFRSPRPPVSSVVGTFWQTLFDWVNVNGEFLDTRPCRQGSAVLAGGFPSLASYVARPRLIFPEESLPPYSAFPPALSWERKAMDIHCAIDASRNTHASHRIASHAGVNFLIRSGHLIAPPLFFFSHPFSSSRALQYDEAPEFTAAR